MMLSALYTGWVMHRRLRPRHHRFKYRVFAMLLDLDELPALDRRLRLFGWNRAGRRRPSGVSSSTSRKRPACATIAATVTEGRKRSADIGRRWYSLRRPDGGRARGWHLRGALFQIKTRPVPMC